MKNSKLSNNLCQDLIIEIFTWLPLRSLLRFRSVSKSLCACIGSPDFIRLHALRSPEKLIMIVQELNHEGVDHLCSPCTSVTAVESPFTNFRIVGCSSNGIICLTEYGKDGINLWNPSIRRKLTAQDRLPTKCQFSYVFGFGYDPIMDDYKILRYTRTKLNKQEVYSVYTLKTDTWCEIRGPAPRYSHVYSRQCLLNGTLHWVVQCKLIDQSEGRVYNYHIMTFDLSTDVFSAIPLPEKSGVLSQVTIVKGFLAVTMSSEDDNTWIWVRKEESWSVAFNINTTRIERPCKVLQLPANGDLLMQSYNDEILVYNPETHVKSRLEKFKSSRRLHAMELCIEGLGLLHMGTKC